VAVGDGRLGYDNDNGDIELCGSRASQIYQHQVGVPRSRGEWHLVPAMAGGKNSSTGKIIFSIIIGGALLATGIGGALDAAALPGTGASLGLSFGLGASSGFLGLSYGTIALMGAGFLLGGLNMLIAPTPKTSSADKKPTSFAFDGPGEIDDEGGPVPILLGEAIIGGVRVASALTSEGANPGSHHVHPIGGGAGGSTPAFHEYFETGSTGTTGPGVQHLMLV
jgi:predicted phage tail protein